MKGFTPRRSKSRRVFTLLGVAMAMILLGMLAPWLVTSIGTFVMYPIHHVNRWLDESTSFVPVLVRDRAELNAEIKQLETQLAELSGSSATLRRLQDENSALRKLLNTEKGVRIVAGVIARPNDLPYDVIQIDRGTRHGIQTGAPVFVGQDTVIGLVTQSALDYSFVTLLTTPGFKSTGFVTGANVVAEVEGYGGGVARVRVPQGIPLQTGNLVHVLGIEPGILGTISYIDTRPTQPEQYGFITPDIPLQSLHYVAVGTDVISEKSIASYEGRLSDLYFDKLVLDLNDASTTASSTASSDSEN